MSATAARRLERTRRNRPFLLLSSFALAFWLVPVAVAEEPGETAAPETSRPDSLDEGDQPQDVEAMVVYGRARSAVGVGSEIAHQVHGAMGFTMEYSLHQLTRRLWSWRDQFGSEAEWATMIGAQVCAGDADDLWAYIASHG